MNNIFSKLLCAVIIAATSFSSKAGNNDSTLLAGTSATSKSFTRTTVIEANIIYPSILADHREESIDYIQKFSNNKRNYLIRTFKRGKAFFPKIAAVLKRYHLPQELKVLMALESAFNPNALSIAGAKGYWQIMDDVAKEYGLQIANAKNKKDDRTNFTKSTLAAAKYLKDRCKNLNNNLLLMVASYNWGIGNIWNAMKKTGKSSPDFWDIKKYLPAETKAYVMNFIALNVIFENYDKFINNKLVFNDITVEVPATDNHAVLNTSVTN